MAAETELHAGLARLRAHDFSARHELEHMLREHWERQTFDEFLALEAIGYTSLDFAGQYGLTMDELIEVAYSHPDDILRTKARILLAAFLEMQRMLWAKFPVQLDLMLIWSDRAHGAACPSWRASMQRTVQRIPWKTRGRAEEQALLLRAANSARTKQEQYRAETETAIMLALDSLDYRQYVRLGTQWIKDATTGRKVKVRPGELSWPFLWRWLRKEVPRLARASLRDESCEPDRATISQRLWTHDGPVGLDSEVEAAFARGKADSDPLNVLCHRERFQELLAALNRAPARERELLALLRSGTGLAEAADLMGIRYKTASELKRRLRARIPDIKAG